MTRTIVEHEKYHAVNGRLEITVFDDGSFEEKWFDFKDRVVAYAEYTPEGEHRWMRHDYEDYDGWFKVIITTSNGDWTCSTYENRRAPREGVQCIRFETRKFRPHKMLNPFAVGYISEE